MVKGPFGPFRRLTKQSFCFLQMCLLTRSTWIPLVFSTNICFHCTTEERVPPFWLKMSHVIYFFVCRMLESTTNLSSYGKSCVLNLTTSKKALNGVWYLISFWDKQYSLKNLDLVFYKFIFYRKMHFQKKGPIRILVPKWPNFRLFKAKTKISEEEIRTNG